MKFILTPLAVFAIVTASLAQGAECPNGVCPVGAPAKRLPSACQAPAKRLPVGTGGTVVRVKVTQTDEPPRAPVLRDLAHHTRDLARAVAFRLKHPFGGRFHHCR